MSTEDLFLKKLGQKLKRLRQEKKMTQEHIALEIGLDRAFISEIENGHRNPSIYTVKRILNYLGESFSSLD